MWLNACGRIRSKNNFSATSQSQKVTGNRLDTDRTEYVAKQNNFRATF
jgi:hypothetical protein